ncbi:MAG: hypothetical protein HYV59_05930 [Planctomycetes bacterium]|nr:hypothetical protein [Planctomycetota bacterium]
MSINKKRLLVLSFVNFLKQGHVEDAIPFLRKVFPNEEEMLKYVIMLYNPSQEKMDRKGG